MIQKLRIEGGLINRKSELNFTFNGKVMKGYQGDTLASALLANGRKLVGRSFKYHRPRGIFTAGSEEPNALVQLRSGAFTEPNTRATTAELFEGLEAKSQNHRGSLEFDILAMNDLMAPFLSAGFYYKTFMWPKKFWERFYEPMIRSAAGLGRLSGLEDPDHYDKGFLHCDLLIIGAGPAGLIAALTAGRSGARVILADEDFLMGGRLNSENYEVDGLPGSEWAKQAVDELRSMNNVRLLNRTTIYGAFDHGIYGALERKTDHLADADGKPRQVLWRIYSKRAILCAGSTERSIAFGNNDRPGIMLAGAVRTYANRFGVAAGRKVTVFTNNHDGWQTALDLQKKGVGLAAIIDTRDREPVHMLSGVDIHMGARIVNSAGRKALKSVTLANGQKIETDCLAVAGGWNPNLHLSGHQRGRPQWNENIASFVPGEKLPEGMLVAGAAKGHLTLGATFADAQEMAEHQLEDLGFKPKTGDTPLCTDEDYQINAFWHVAESTQRAWLDLQNDVTTKDVRQSQMEGFRSVEHLKRYTTLGMATDQGKTANINALAVMAELTGKSIEETGTTIYRPPYNPVSLGALAGRSRGKEFRPIRYTPSHQWAEENGAEFVEAGNWLRAQWFTRRGERHWRQSVDREVIQTRRSVGICDVTTLGKIDIQGRDAAEFLNRVYVNGFAKLPVGKCRYGLMLREDGIAYDDGTTARLAENHYVMTTTTANAVLVFQRLEFARQCLWPELDVHLISITDGWSQYAIAGPNSRALLEKVVDQPEQISNEAFPFMGCREITICGGVSARLFRISFSGELAYELAVPRRYGASLMDVLMKAGEEFDVVAYGTEALGVMRIEKGHAAGNELIGQTTALNLGLERMVSTKKDFIGNVLAKRPELCSDDAVKLMGFQPVNRRDVLIAGAHFVASGNPHDLEHDEGWMSSVCHSPTLGYAIGLGFIKSGDKRVGEKVLAVSPVHKQSIEVEIVSPHFVDPEGVRLRG